MLEKYMGYVPAASIAALVLVAVFNVGYFWPIGIHFLGVMDAANLVYSFALIVGVLYVLLIFAQGQFLQSLSDFLRREDGYEKIRKAGYRYFFPLSMLCMFAGFLVPAPHASAVLSQSLFAAGFGVFFIWLLARDFAFHSRWGPPRFGDLVTPLFIFACCVGSVGQAVGAYEAFYTDATYELIAKDGPTRIVRLVRASSNGFVVTVGNRVMYYPKDEVRRIAATNETKLR